MILAIDPGPVESAWVEWNGERVFGFGKIPNLELMGICRAAKGSYRKSCVIEMIASYGMPVGAEVFETCVWIGRFMEAFGADRCHRIPRIQVKSHLCHSGKATDANIRQAIIDRFGGKEKAIGKKAAPGPLYGVSGDVWSALAVGLTWWDLNRGEDANGMEAGSRLAQL